MNRPCSLRRVVLLRDRNCCALLCYIHLPRHHSNHKKRPKAMVVKLAKSSVRWERALFGRSHPVCLSVTNDIGT